MKRVQTALFFPLAFSIAVASQRPATYSLNIELMKLNAETLPERRVYIWPWVKNPGAYPYKPGMTVADLVQMAGGIIQDARFPTMPSQANPQTVFVLRPGPENPDPYQSIFSMRFDWSIAKESVSQCKFKLLEGDFVGISMSGCVP